MLKKKLLILWLVLGFLGIQSITSHPANSATLRDIQRRGALVVAVKDNLRPLGFRDDRGNLQGLEIDLAKRLARDLVGRESPREITREETIDLQPVRNSDRLNAVISGRVDLAIAQITVTNSRSRLVEFSIPYYADGTSLITKNLATISEITNQSIAILNGSSTAGEVRFRFPQARIITVNSYQAGKETLDRGEAIAFAGDTSVLTGWVQNYSEYRLFSRLELYSNSLAIAMPKGEQYQELRQQINILITRYQQEGWLQERIRHWGLPE
jgi:polar amino acid transport system substrate-binding protein